MAVTASVEREGLFPATSHDDIARPALVVTWRSVAFVHWAYEPDAVARLLPPSVSVDLYGGRAWAGYQFLTVTLGRLRRSGASSSLDPRSWRRRLGPELDMVQAVVPVVDSAGRPALWCLSLDTNRAVVASALRRRFNLPAYEAESRFSRTDGRFTYWTHRPDGTMARLDLTVGPAITPTDIDRFLTARWRVVLPPRWWDQPDDGRSLLTFHEPWRLHRASVELFDDEVLVAAGLPPAAGPAQALWSPGTPVRLGRSRHAPAAGICSGITGL